MMVIIKQFVFSLVASIGFAGLFNIPKDSIFKSGTVGALGWIVFYVTSIIFKSNIAGTFFAAITVAILGELSARHFKKPATVYIIPGIVPLVPGAGMYYTMLGLVEKDFITAANKGTETMFIAAAISLGLIVSTSLSKPIKRIKHKD